MAGRAGSQNAERMWGIGRVKGASQAPALGRTDLIVPRAALLKGFLAAFDTDRPLRA